MDTIYVVLYERYEQRPRSTHSHGIQVDSTFTDKDRAVARAAFLNEPAERDYSEGSRASVSQAQVDPEVYVAQGGDVYSHVTESNPRSTKLEWTIECQVRDLEQLEQSLKEAKREDYDSDADFKIDVVYYSKAIEEGTARLAELKERFSAKLGPVVAVS